ncbi:DUF4304 domain-containing protein (plasmid) [Aliiroseovarius crassostreae]|uniref:DUF4304 domain-containing protein n=1 Tax=Aliiroseovarius crassostreae TaxID=154981 RepID=UPI00220FB6A7|nr:DUF4304 domain-containing protein [Aliiroseovarius crassostreae]UWQ09693.1 DUF4304 domain-containing protein [Aliiroseovarius crassostreae]UWQ12812.1 DUF4304 domain-containing protein [Aliiroseovarius crassostreae]
MNLEEFSHTRLTPFLIEKGFKGRGRTFRRVSGRFEQLVKIQKGQRGTQGKFCIDLYAHPLIEGYPGLPDLPLRAGDHWFCRRLAPSGLEDKWWWTDKLYRSDTEQIIQLLSDDLDAWFSETESLKQFSDGWYRQVYNLEYAAKRLGLLPARLAYHHAVVCTAQGHAETAMRIAGTAVAKRGQRPQRFERGLRHFRKR